METDVRLVVAIHDVAPPFAREVETFWDLCVARGITPALFVVPHWHGQWKLEDDPRFCAWLRRAEAAGAEVFLHGERHDEVGARRRLLHELRALGRTAHEGEFLTLPQSVARNRVARGLKRLRSIGLDPIGFVAPAWLWAREHIPVIADLGLRYSEDESSIHLLARSMAVRSPVIRWSARSAWRARASVAVAAVRRMLERGQSGGSSLLRIALHPQDLRSAPVRRSLLLTLDHYASRALPTPYSGI